MIKQAQQQKRLSKLLQLLKAKIFQELSAAERLTIKQQLAQLQLDYQTHQLADDDYQIKTVSLLLSGRRSPEWTEQFLFYHATPFLSPAIIFAIVQKIEQQTQCSINEEKNTSNN